MSVSGFKINGVIEKYNYADLDNIDVQTSHIHDEAVTADKLANEAVTADKLANEAVTADKIDSDYDASLAKVDGAYEQMTVGNAEQLVSTVFTEDKVPYNFRTTGGSADVGNREIDMIVGGTIAWNQLCPATAATRTLNDVEITNNGDGTFTLNGTCSSTARFQFGTPTIHLEHKYLIRGISGGSSTKGYFCVTSSGVIKSPNVYNDGIFAFSANGNQFSFRIVSGAVYDNYVVRPQLFDITAMFGSAIADYAYTLESGTAGSGIAWLQKYGFFEKDYYPYKTATLESVNVSAHTMVGFNAYNPSTGKAKVVGGNNYQITGAYTALSLNGTTVTPDASGYFTPSESGELTVTGGDSTTTCVHLVWDGEKDGEFEDYSEHTYALDSDLTLRGIPKLDASNNLYYDGDVYESDGTVTRNYASRAYTNGDSTDGSTMITDGTTTVYRLTTPTTESADPYTNPQICDDFGTEEYVDAAYVNGDRDFAMPCGHDTRYQNNLRAKLEMVPNSPSGDGFYGVRHANGVSSYEQIAFPAPSFIILSNDVRGSWTTGSSIQATIYDPTELFSSNALIATCVFIPNGKRIALYEAYRDDEHDTIVLQSAIIGNEYYVVGEFDVGSAEWQGSFSIIEV